MSVNDVYRGFVKFYMENFMNVFYRNMGRIFGMCKFVKGEKYESLV